MTTDQELQSQLLGLLRGEGARMPFDEAVSGFPAKALNQRAPNVPFSPWALLEHIRLTQWDILDYIRNPAYSEQEWPRDYWPPPGTEATAEDFDRTVADYRADNEALQAIVADPETDLLAVIPNTPGHTILREVRIVGDHNSYHLGEFGLMREVMGTWPAARRS
jgi:hypothetical protein